MIITFRPIPPTKSFLTFESPPKKDKGNTQSTDHFSRSNLNMKSLFYHSNIDIEFTIPSIIMLRKTFKEWEIDKYTCIVVLVQIVNS